MKHDDSNMKHNDSDMTHDRNDSNDPLSNSADASRASQFSADDPRLTACALGEMDAAERAAFEAEIRDNPAAQAAIAEIRTLAGELEIALATEPLPAAASPAMHSPAAAEDWRAIREAEAHAVRKRERARARANKPFHFPYFLIAGLATACFALVFFTVVKPDYDLQRERELKRKQANAKWELERNRDDAANRLRMQNEQLAYAEAKRDENAAVENVVRYELGLNQAASPGAPEQYRPVELPASQPQVASGNFRSTPAARTPATKSMATVIASDSFNMGRPDGGTIVVPRPAAIAPITGTESYTRHTDNAFLRVADNPLSTFSADIDTASYTNVRRFLNASRLPPRDAVRIEEMVNYFSYDYAPPAKDNTAPFAATMEVAAAPWNPEHRLVRIGIKGREIDNATRPPASLVFLIDVSGSMDAPNKLPLVKESMRMLVNRLRPDDRIAIVTYANTIALALPSTSAGDKTKILDTLDSLRATGGTNGGKGIQLAYEIARANFLKDGANRVILCTDGDFNIGITNRDELTRLIEEKAKSGVFLTVLGFGMGNLKDSTLQLLADKGNGNHGYIDTRDEARRLLVEQTAGTLVTIAKDVKLQVEFNPAQAGSYRLIGYEKRLLAKEDFNNDKVDAGEIGAGHTVTALYEIIPAKAVSGNAGVGSDAGPDAPQIPTVSVDPLKYQTRTVVTTTPKLELKGELLTLKIRYKAPSSDMSDKVEFVLEDKGADFPEASPDFKFTCSIAAFGMILRDSADKGLATYDRVLEWAEAGMGNASGADHTRRGEFTDLVRRARQIATNRHHFIN